MGYLNLPTLEVTLRSAINQEALNARQIGFFIVGKNSAPWL